MCVDKEDKDLMVNPTNERNKVITNNKSIILQPDEKGSKVRPLSPTIEMISFVQPAGGVRALAIGCSDYFNSSVEILNIYTNKESAVLHTLTLRRVK